MTNEEKAVDIISISNTNQVYDIVDFNSLHEALYEDLMGMAEWVERQMLAKACEWLNNNTISVTVDTCTYTASSNDISKEEFIKVFKQAMKE